MNKDQQAYFFFSVLIYSCFVTENVLRLISLLYCSSLSYTQNAAVFGGRRGLIYFIFIYCLYVFLSVILRYFTSLHRGVFKQTTARPGNLHVWFNSFTTNLDFWAIFSQIAPRKPLYQGYPLGGTFLTPRGTILATATTLSHCPCLLKPIGS